MFKILRMNVIFVFTYNEREKAKAKLVEKKERLVGILKKV
jgi:hypothetical protein